MRTLDALRITLALDAVKRRISWPRMTRDYEKDPNPENWRTIHGSKVHLTNGRIDGGAGGIFTGNSLNLRAGNFRLKSREECPHPPFYTIDNVIKYM